MDILLTLASMAIGGLVTWFAAWHYYKKAGEELKSEAKKLRDLSHMILSWLEVDGNNIEVRRDNDGNPIGLNRVIKCEAEEIIINAPTVGDFQLKKVNKEKKK